MRCDERKQRLARPKGAVTEARRLHVPEVLVLPGRVLQWRKQSKNGMK